MSQVICHRCQEPTDRDQCSSHTVWEGAITARRVSKLFCFECLSEIRAEQEEQNHRYFEGEDWKPGYEDNDSEERWKDE